MLKINTTAKYAELKFDDKSDLYPLNEISYTVENDSETVSFYNRFYNKIVTEQISNIQVNDVPVTRDNIQELLSVLFAGYEVTGGGTVDLSNYYTKPETNTLLDTKVDKVEGKQLSTEDYTTEEKIKLAGLENYDDSAVKSDIAANAEAIEAEVERATATDATLQSNINKEETRARTAEKELDIKVSTKVDKVDGKQLSAEDYTTAEKEKLASLSNYNDTTVKGDIAANTEAIEAEVTRAKAAESALDTKVGTKVDKVSGKQLSTNDFTTSEKSKLASLSNYDDSDLRTLIETKADKDKYKKLIAKEYSSFTVFNMDMNMKFQYIDISEVLTNKIEIFTSFDISNEISEEHLLIKGDSSKTITFKGSGFDFIWKETPVEMVNGAFYEFIFTWIKSQNKIHAGYIKYE